MLERALRHAWLPLQYEGPYSQKAYNAREGIETFSVVFAPIGAESLGQKAYNAREGIETLLLELHNFHLNFLVRKHTMLERALRH